MLGPQPKFLFTSGSSESVDFINLTTDQQAAIAGGADIYRGLGGSDVVMLPNILNYNESIGNSQTLNWQSGSTFYTGDTAGQNYTITGGDGTYKVSLGTGNDQVNIGAGTVEITSAVDQTTTVSFTQPSGALLIDQPANFQGQIAGFVPVDPSVSQSLAPQGDVIELANTGNVFDATIYTDPASKQSTLYVDEGTVYE